VRATVTVTVTVTVTITSTVTTVADAKRDFHARMEDRRANFALVGGGVEDEFALGAGGVAGGAGEQVGDAAVRVADPRADFGPRAIAPREQSHAHAGRGLAKRGVQNVAGDFHATVTVEVTVTATTVTVVATTVVAVAAT